MCWQSNAQSCSIDPVEGVPDDGGGSRPVTPGGSYPVLGGGSVPNGSDDGLAGPPSPEVQPAAISPPNWNKTFDLGLWQINSSHWGQSAACGSRDELVVPINNARCAMSILGPGLNYCAWSTFEASCGVGHTSAYRAFMAGASQIAQGIAWQH